MLLPHNQNELALEIIDGLLHPTHPTCCQVVVMPGFEEETFASHLVSQIKAREDAPPLAVVSADEVDRIEDFIALLSSQWQLDTKATSAGSEMSPLLRLKRLLEALSEDHPRIQIVKHFDVILDSLDAPVLAHLRLAEQRKGLRTVTLLPFPYDEVKRRWEQRGNKLTTSDYGVSPMHAKHMLMPAQAACDCYGLPRYVIDTAFNLSGGFPGYFNELVGVAVRRQQLISEVKRVPEVLKEMRLRGVELFRKLVRDLDGDNEKVLREHVIQLHLDINRDDSLYSLSRHPIGWGQALLSESQTELRSECVGPAALAVDYDESIVNPLDKASGSVALDRARELYSRKQFQDSNRWLQKVPWNHKPTIQLFRAHADIMENVYASGIDISGNDSDWTKVSSGIKSARELLPSLAASCDCVFIAFLNRRYDKLEEVAKAICAITKQKEPRIVDFLAGLLGEQKMHSRIGTLGVLKLLLDSADSIPGNSLACQASLNLPEQIFRVWAYWKLGVNYYISFDSAEEEWDDVAREWGGNFERPRPGGKEFPNFRSFVFFCLARLRRKGDDVNSGPSPDFKSLKQDLSKLEIRNAAAHATSVFSKQNRVNYFDVIRRWYAALVSSSGIPETADEISEMISPLPLPSESHI